MPKGDRLILKADPEDGTTPIANLLLEAVAMAKISGLQKGAILHLWRETYGWIDDSGKRRKECKISLTEWMRALDSSKSRTSSALTELNDKGIIKRRTSEAWGGYYYSLNTNISQWNSDCLNISKLSECIGVPVIGTVAQNGTVPNNDNSSNKDNSCPKHNGTVAQNGTEQLPKTEHRTLYKEILNKDKERTIIILPEFIDKELWDSFLEMRKKSKKPPTDRAKELLIKDLEKYKESGDDPNEILKRSIKNNWQGLFPIKDKPTNKKPSKYGDGW